MELIYRRLRGIAGGLMASERAGHRLQPTALVNEAFLKLRDRFPTFENRRHLLAAMGTAMDQLLTDHARARGTQKRTPTAGSRAIRPEEIPVDP